VSTFVTDIELCLGLFDVFFVVAYSPSVHSFVYVKSLPNVPFPATNMKPLYFASLSRRLTSTTPWTCTNCRTQLFRQGKTQRPSSRQHSRGPSGSSRGNPRTRTRVAVLTATATGAAGAGVLAFTDDIKYGYDVTERTGRVAATLALCINE
jgi:aarF domain-containing kinase